MNAFNNNNEENDHFLVQPMLDNVKTSKAAAATNDCNQALQEDLFYSHDDNLLLLKDHTIVRVFSIDYDRLVQRLKRAKWFAAGAAIVLFIVTAVWGHQWNEDDRDVAILLPVVMTAIFVGMWCTEGQNELRIRGQHVAVAQRGIRRDIVNHHGVHTTTTLPWQQVRHVQRRPGGLVSIVMVNRSHRSVEIDGLHDVEGFIELVNELQEKEELALAPTIL